ncbi:MAG: hypothetical protein Q9174_002692 [Haloplaca sp. 1 TL-2023]
MVITGLRYSQRGLQNPQKLLLSVLLVLWTVVAAAVPSSSFGPALTRDIESTTPLDLKAQPDIFRDLTTHTYRRSDIRPGLKVNDDVDYSFGERSERTIIEATVEAVAGMMGVYLEFLDALSQINVDYFANNRTLVICFGAFSLSVQVQTQLEIEGGSHKRQAITVIDTVEQALHMLEDWASRGFLFLGRLVMTVGKISLVLTILNVMQLMLERPVHGCLHPKLQLVTR